MIGPDRRPDIQLQGVTLFIVYRESFGAAPLECITQEWPPLHVIFGRAESGGWFYGDQHCGGGVSGPLNRGVPLTGTCCYSFPSLFHPGHPSISISTESLTWLNLFFCTHFYFMYISYFSLPSNLHPIFSPDPHFPPVPHGGITIELQMVHYPEDWWI